MRVFLAAAELKISCVVDRHRTTVPRKILPSAREGERGHAIFRGFCAARDERLNFPPEHSTPRPREKATRSIVRSIIIALEFRNLFFSLVFRAQFNYRRINVVAARVD